MNIGNKKINKIYVFFLVIIILATIVGTGFNKDRKGIRINGKFIASRSNTISVYLSGEIKTQGVVTVKEGSLLQTAIDKCGGITKEADVQKIDFNMKLKHGDKVIINSKQKSEDVIKEINSGNEKVNINEAEAYELEELDGIGPATSQKIIEYRELKRFESIDDIMQVKGIGEIKYNNIKEKISVN